MGEVRPKAPGSASEKYHFKMPGRAKTAAVVAEEKTPPVPETFLGLLTLRVNSGVGAGCRGGLLSHPSASNSPILGQWFLRGGAMVDSG